MGGGRGWSTSLLLTNPFQQWRPFPPPAHQGRMETSCHGSPTLQGFCHRKRGTINPSDPTPGTQVRGPGSGNQIRAPWRLSTIPCCSELKMALREPTNTVRLKGQAWEAGGPRGGPGAFEDPE